MAINVSVQHNERWVSPRCFTATVDPMILPSGNPFKCHEEVLYMQPMIPPTKRFDRECSEGPDAFRFFFKQ